MDLCKKMEEEKYQTVGKAIPIPFEPDSPEKKEFFDTFDRYLSPEGKDYVLDTLRILGPTNVAQMAFGHEFVDRCQEVREIIESKLDPCEEWGQI